MQKMEVVAVVGELEFSERRERVHAYHLTGLGS